MDEHRIGLTPILRRVWVRQGSRPQARVQPRFHWLSVSCFVQPATGQREWLVLPSVNVPVFSLALAHLAHAVGVGATKRVLLVLDQAGWHTSREVVIPAGSQFLFLPPYSPSLQPCERLWPLSHEGIANRQFQNLEDLENAQAQRCVILRTQRELIRSRTAFH